MTAHRLWMESREPATTSNAPGDGVTRGAEVVSTRTGVALMWGVDTPNLRDAGPKCKGLCHDP
jgi:hypothetical protein